MPLIQIKKPLSIVNFEPCESRTKRFQETPYMSFFIAHFQHVEAKFKYKTLCS
jgi:hypothetical protein